MSKSLGGIIKLKRIGYFRRDLVVLGGCLELELELRCYSLEPHISFICFVQSFANCHISLYSVYFRESFDTNMDEQRALVFKTIAVVQICKNF